MIALERFGVSSVKSVQRTRGGLNSIGVDDGRIAEHGEPVGAMLKGRKSCLNAARQQQVIAGNHGDEFAVGACQKSVQGFGNARVLLAFENHVLKGIRMLRQPSLCDRERFVFRTVVNDDHFEVWMALIGETLECRCDVACMVIKRHDDADQWATRDGDAARGVTHALTLPRAILREFGSDGTLPNVIQPDVIQSDVIQSDLRTLSIIIPSYNGRVALEQTLDCLKREAPDAEVIVVDAGSSDGSRELILERFAQMRLLDVPNHGYGHNINRGLEVAHGRTLVMMNSDVLISRETLLAMQSRLETDGQLAAVGPLPLRPDGRKQFSFGFVYWPNWWPIRAPSNIKMLHGYCIATRRDVLENQGMFDEVLFFYNEEYDWCWRVLKAGYRLEILPETALHFGGASTPGKPGGNAKILLESQRGGMYVVDKHFPRWIAQATRRFFQLYGWLGGMLHPNPEFRVVFRTLEQMVKRGEYRESPFPLSGRGVVRLEPVDRGDG